jgi:Kelch motif
MFTSRSLPSTPNSVSPNNSMNNISSSTPLLEFYSDNNLELNRRTADSLGFTSSGGGSARRIDGSQRKELNLFATPRSTGKHKPEHYSGLAGFWERVPTAVNSSVLPCQRSLHAAAVWKDLFLVFGGYDGEFRVNDLHAYNFITHQWQRLLSASGATSPPSARDRHIAAVCDNTLYIFGGFDGHTRVAGMH